MRNFEASGEGPLFLNMLAEGCERQVGCHVVAIISTQSTEGIDLSNPTDVGDCVGRAVVTEATMFGLPSELLDLTAKPAGETCTLEFPLPGRFVVFDGERAHMYQVDLGNDTPDVVVVLAPITDFDGFLEEEAQPLLDSVRFLDG